MAVLRPQAAARATRFLAREGIRIPAGYRRSVSFVADYENLAYLEQTLGLAESNRSHPIARCRAACCTGTRCPGAGGFPSPN